MKKNRLIAVLFIMLAMFVAGLFADSLTGNGAALAAERKAKDIKVVLYMTDW
jgi:hypothetical protein